LEEGQGSGCQRVEGEEGTPGPGLCAPDGPQSGLRGGVQLGCGLVIPRRFSFFFLFWFLFQIEILNADKIKQKAATQN